MPHTFTALSSPADTSLPVPPAPALPSASAVDTVSPSLGAEAALQPPAMETLFPPAAAAPLRSPSGAAIGTVRGLALRGAGARAPVPVELACADAGLGFGGDVHADPLSPRQLLLAGAPAYTRHGLAPLTLRENLLLDIDTAALASGTLLRVGSQAVLWLTFHCEACNYLDARHPGIAQRIGRGRGVLARVVRGGTIRVGDPVVLLPGSCPVWSDDWRERVAAILARVPAGMVVEYRHLARLAGIQPVYCRTFPRLTRTLGYAHAATPMFGQPELPRWAGHALFDVQCAEGCG
ncbi:hypothetical protein IP92_01199 [Pseudoduganella flava]|uniref:MOSC domain-containing protein n=1 Tax=Pseudoduganella flava TaxID=871742 RepID=A0A562PZV9_9BURK|nr:MOSC domain-containing protein [Pseudoduganella flava]QGZ38474.1 hypothetical protein GO485_05005 [Pseudoduganella flava]TWI49975.1 hypothetical protein IP92_01199 [Pseudoduganella flava]